MIGRDVVKLSGSTKTGVGLEMKDLFPESSVQFCQDRFEVARGGNWAMVDLKKKEKATSNHFNFVASAQ